MHVLEVAGRAAAEELAAWAQDPLRYQPRLRAFVAEHDLLPVIHLAQELSATDVEAQWGRQPGYGWQHGLRVAAHALELADCDELAGREIDRVALFVAALGHDLVHVRMGDDHQREGADLVAAHLPGLLDPERVAKVVRWIADSDHPVPDGEVEQQLLWDANALDLHGLVFIVRGLMHGAANGLAPEVMLQVFDAVREVHGQWLQFAHFATSRRMWEERTAAELEFVRTLAREIGHPLGDRGQSSYLSDQRRGGAASSQR